MTTTAATAATSGPSPSRLAPGARRHLTAGGDPSVPRQALSLTVAVDGGDPAMRAAMVAALGALAPATSATHRYRVGRGADGTVDVWRDGELVAGRVPAGEAAEWVVWDCTRLAVAVAPELLLHAGAVAGRRGAVLLPGPSGAGKSTLVAALVRGGHDYLSDELVALDGAGWALPFPRGLGLDARARLLLGRLHGVRTAHVPPDALRPGSVSGRRPVAAVVVPRLAPGARTELVAPPTDRAVLALATAAVNLPAHGTEGLRSLAALAARCACHELVVGDLEEARAALSTVVAP